MQESQLNHSCAVMTQLSQLRQVLVGMDIGGPNIAIALQYLDTIATLRVDKSNANQIINILMELIDALSKSNNPHRNKWCLELDSFCFRLSIPRGEFRYSKHEIYRKLRAEQLALIWPDTDAITPAQQSMLSLLTQVEQLFRSAQPQRPRIMIEFRLPTLDTDPSDRWIVTFLYDLISHLELAGIQTLVWRQSSKAFYSKVKFDLLRGRYQDIDLSAELGCHCIFTVPSQLSKQDFQFKESGYLNTLKLLIRKFYDAGQQDEAYVKLWENHSTISASLPAKISQFSPDRCGLIAIVEPRLAKLDLLSAPYNCSLPIAPGTQHLLVTKTDPIEGSEVTALPGADIQINSVYANVLRKE
ncbi:MAG: hypothetical protein K2X50_09195 [Gammaproteobacteria bacterium]|nr:hypothetical protein [Gammaproteobacteria bacterium]